jgi:hypothetical protein
MRNVISTPYFDSLVLIYNSLKSQPGWPYPHRPWLYLPHLKSAYLYLALIIGTLLFVGVVEYLNGRRIERLMDMLEEVAERESTTCSSRRTDMKSMDRDDIGSEIVY